MISSSHELIIEPDRAGRQYWRDLWRYRELFCFLAWRDLLIRYKQTVVGVAWSLLRPLLTMVIFVFVFGKLARLPSPGVPYPILVLAALLPWQFFSNALAECGNSLVSNANLISKVYFPRLVVPASAIITSFVDFLISGLFLVLLMVIYQFTPTWRICALPLFVLLAFAATLGGGLWLAALTVRYRDFRFIIPFIVQFGFFISPVGYSSEVVPEQWRPFYSLNPMVGVIDGFRWSIYGQHHKLYGPALVSSLVLISASLWSGLVYFRRTEHSFADVI